ncbi:MAG: lipopolysaccharide biosynthesis protein, partial [Burkholderiales bacterium]|nr:lipopolysaccharide biosynthesis protein [Burkholderiales bacterium]
VVASIRRSLAFSALDSYLGLTLQLVSTVIISRILTPAETGVFAVAAVFAARASTFRDFGVAEFLIQEQQLTPQKIQAALAVNILISWAMGLLLFFGAPFAADFYRTPGIASVMRVQAFNFLLIPFGAVTMAYFRRELDFKPIFIAGILANLTSFIVAVTCAWRGLSYMSLAWSSLAGVIVTVSASIWFRPAHFPRWPGLTGVADVFHFGKFASGIYILGQVGRGAPEMIIGRAYDMAAVAIFSRGNGLVELFNKLVLQAILPVCMPYFAKSSREQGGMLQGYLSSVSYLTAVGWPFLGYLGLTAYAAIRIVYGPQWTAAAPLAQIVCAAACIELVYHMTKEALLADGRVKQSNALQFGVQGSFLVGLLAVIPFGLVGGCWGILLGRVAGAWIAHRYLHGAIGLRAMDVLRACLPSAQVAIGAIAPVALWVTFEPITEANFVRFALIGGAMTGLAWFACLRYFGHPLWSEVVRIADGLSAARRAPTNPE